MNPIESLSVVRGAIRATAVPERSAPSRPAQRAATQVITISRQAGIEAGAVALATAGLLATPWQSYDRQLIDCVAREHHLSPAVVTSRDEHDESLVEYAMHGLGSTEPTEVIPVKIAQTIRRLADEGHAIIVGRGGQFVLAGRDSARHVRLIAPEPWRVEAFAAATGVSRAEALKTVHRIDADRTRYAKAHFSRDPGDPLAYDLVLNMAHLDVGQASRAIATLLPTA